SLALVYPSQYEGFGIPPLEAMACGTPVVAASSSSIPEVVGEAGLLFDPFSSSSLAELLLDLFKNPGKRDELIKKGLVQVSHFSWDKMVKEIVNVYESL